MGLETGEYCHFWAYKIFVSISLSWWCSLKALPNAGPLRLFQLGLRSHELPMRPQVQEAGPHGHNRRNRAGAGRTGRGAVGPALRGRRGSPLLIVQVPHRPIHQLVGRPLQGHDVSRLVQGQISRHGLHVVSLQRRGDSGLVVVPEPERTQAPTCGTRGHTARTKRLAHSLQGRVRLEAPTLPPGGCANQAFCHQPPGWVWVRRVSCGSRPFYPGP